MVALTPISRPPVVYPVHAMAVDPIRITGIYAFHDSYGPFPGFFRENPSGKLIFPWLHNGEDPVGVPLEVHPCGAEDRWVLEDLQRHVMQRYSMGKENPLRRFRKYYTTDSTGTFLKPGKVYEVHCVWLDRSLRFIVRDTETLGRFAKALEVQHKHPVTRAWVLERLFTPDLVYRGACEYPGAIELGKDYRVASGVPIRLTMDGLQRCGSLTLDSSWEVTSVDLHECRDIHITSPFWEGFRDYRSPGYSLKTENITGIRGPVHMLPSPDTVQSGPLGTSVSVLFADGGFDHTSYVNFYNCMREVTMASLSTCMNFLTHEWVPVRALVGARVNGTLKFPII